MSKLLTILTSAINLIGKNEVSELLSNLDCDSEATAENCVAAMEKCGDKFTKPFSEMLHEAVKTPAARAKYIVAARALKANGTTKGAAVNGMTAEQKADKGLAFINAFATLIGASGGSVSQITNAVNGTDAAVAQANLMLQQRLLEDATQKKTLYWILGGIGVILIIAIFIIALSKRS